MRIFFSLVLLFIFSSNLFSQFVYEEATEIEVFRSGKKINDPFTSGYTAAQFSELDLNFDGVLDLIVYDRTQGLVRPYINLGIKDSVSYLYKPEYSKKFPKLRDWLLTADYNNDGKLDLFEGGSGMRVWKNTGTKETGLTFEFVDDVKTLYSSSSTTLLKISINKSSLPGIYDIDKDGDLDVFTLNLSDGATIEYHRNLAVERNDSSFLNFELRNACWGNFYDDNGIIRLDDCNGPIPGGERTSPEDDLSQNKPKISNKDKSLKHGRSAMITPVDIDGNSSTDLIISDFDNFKTKLLLNQDSLLPPYVDSRVFATSDFFPSYDVPVDVLYPAIFFLDVNNDGKKDMIACPNALNTSTTFPNLVTENEILYYKNVSENEKMKFELQQRDFLLDQTLNFGIAAHPVFFDYNKDGLMDLVIGNDGYGNKQDISIIGRLELYKNIGTKKAPKFELSDSNYLDIPSLNLNLFSNTPSRNLMPTFGDIDGDGDEDLLLGEVNNNIFFFEDTSKNANIAEFKFHPEPYSGLNIKGLGRTNAPVLYDLNNDNVLDLLVSDKNSTVNYFLNFGSPNKPVFNIRLDSIVFQSNNTFRYYLEDTVDFKYFKIGSSWSVNNGSNPANTASVILTINGLNENKNYIECKNSSATSDASLNEFNTNAYINLYDRSWGNLSESLFTLGAPRLFPYRLNGKTELLVGSESGEVHYYSNIEDTLNSKDIFDLIDETYLPNYGFYSFIDGTDLNNDGLIDLVVGNQSGGIKILMAQYGVGIRELSKDESEKEKNYFDVFPNPSQGFVNVLVKEQSILNSNYTVFDATGKLLLKGVFQNSEVVKIDLTGFQKGIYLLNLQNDSFTQTKKLIIQP